MSKLVNLEIDNGCATVTLNDPAKGNALSLDLLTDLKAALQKITTDKSVRFLVITGSGDHAFSDGSDVGLVENFSAKEVEEYIRLGQLVLNIIYRADIISVAAINGSALGSGLELALSCDIRLAADGAQLGFPEVAMGLIPFFGGTQRLPRMVGLGLTFEMILSGRILSAKDAAEIRLVNHCYKAAELPSKTASMIELLSTDKSPAAQKLARWLIHSSLDLPMSAGLEREIISFSELFSAKDTREAMSRYKSSKNKK